MTRLRGRPIYVSEYPIHPHDLTARLEPFKARLGFGEYPIEVLERTTFTDRSALDEYDAKVGRRWRPESQGFIATTPQWKFTLMDGRGELPETRQAIRDPWEWVNYNRDGKAVVFSRVLDGNSLPVWPGDDSPEVVRQDWSPF